MYDLPPHLQSLNAIQPSGSPPSSALSAEQEAEFWAFMNTDELFSNFGLAPQAFESKQAEGSRKVAEEQAAAAATAAATAAAAATATETKSEVKPAAASPSTLESFLATFAGEATAPTPIPSNYLMAALAPLATTPTATTTPAVAKPADVLPSAPPATPATNEEEENEEESASSEAPRVTGAKRLKMMGAGQAEIEEDKRRRNTEASARFRAKKKAREKALEDRAKDLEAQVATLTAEKASLEKENNLLKFVIVNGQGNGGASADGLQAALAALGKRKQRDE